VVTIIRKEPPPKKRASGSKAVTVFTAAVVEAAFAERGEWVAADLPDGVQASNLSGSMSVAVFKRVAEMTVHQGVVYLRIMAEGDSQ
jgi:hypothetical protein